MRFIDPDTEYEHGEWGVNICGRARIGWDTGVIWIDRTNPNCSGSVLIEIIPHELGHAFGFRHVADRDAIMFADDMNGRVDYSNTEQYHMQLAYEAGRGRPYCGWPYSAACPPQRGALPFRGLGPPIIAAD